MMRSTFSITTIASSTTMPIASTSPNNVSTLIDMPNVEQPEERADDAHRHGEHRDERRAPALQKEEHDERDEHHRLDERDRHFLDRRADERRRVERNAYVHALRERLSAARPCRFTTACFTASALAPGRV